MPIDNAAVCDILMIQSVLMTLTEMRSPRVPLKTLLMLFLLVRSNETVAQWHLGIELLQKPVLITHTQTTKVPCLSEDSMRRYQRPLKTGYLILKNSETPYLTRLNGSLLKKCMAPTSAGLWV